MKHKDELQKALSIVRRWFWLYVM